MSGTYFDERRSPERACRKLKDWPDTDRRLWLAALEPGDLLDGGGARSSYRSISNRKVERGYGRWLTFLARLSKLNGEPANRITTGAVTQYVAELQALGNGSYTVLSRLQELYDAAKVMNPGHEWAWIRRIAGQIRARHVPVREKAPKLVGADDLLDLGLHLIAVAGSLPTDRRRATEFRDGLLLAFLALRPLRLRNLAALKLEQHLQMVGNTWMVLIPAEQTKTGAPLEFPWPEVLISPLHAWLERWRPVLSSRRGRWSRPTDGALWVSKDGSPMTMRAIYDRVGARTHTAFGKAINPHFFRDVAATTVAYADPEHVRISAQLLGHSTFATTERHYVQAMMVEANRRRQVEILRLRHSSPIPATR